MRPLARKGEERAEKCGRWQRFRANGRISRLTYAGVEKGRPVCDRTPSDDTCVLEAYFLIQENMERIFSPVTSMGWELMASRCSRSHLWSLLQSLTNS